MDVRVSRLETPEECEQFAMNVQDRLPELARAARRRGVELQAVVHGAGSTVEQECLQAVYAYERVLREKHGKNVRASRTWQMINDRGIIAAVERAVSGDVKPGYLTLVEMDMADLAFEAVVCRHPEVFSAEAVRRSQERLAAWGGHG